MRKEHEHILQSIAIATAILLVSFIASVLPAHAFIFPSDIQTFTYTNNINQVVNQTLIYTNVAGETLTLLGSDMNNGGGNVIGNETHIFCGTTIVIDNMAVSATGQMFHAIKCSQNIYADIGKYTHIRLSYVSRNIATTPDPLGDLTATVVSTSTSPLYVQDAGNLSFLLTILISLMFLMVVGFVYNNMTNKKPWH